MMSAKSAHLMTVETSLTPGVHHCPRIGDDSDGFKAMANTKSKRTMWPDQCGGFVHTRFGRVLATKRPFCVCEYKRK